MVYNLSGGKTKILPFARAMVNNPELFFVMSQQQIWIMIILLFY